MYICNVIFVAELLHLKNFYYPIGEKLQPSNRWDFLFYKNMEQIRIQKKDLKSSSITIVNDDYDNHILIEVQDGKKTTSIFLSQTEVSSLIASLLTMQKNISE